MSQNLVMEDFFHYLNILYATLIQRDIITLYQIEMKKGMNQDHELYTIMLLCKKDEIIKMLIIVEYRDFLLFFS